MHKSSITKKLFFNKYLYKITVTPVLSRGDDTYTLEMNINRALIGLDYRKRTESRKISIFTNDVKVINKIKSLKLVILEISVPKKEHIKYLQSNKNIIVSDKVDYRYKVSFNYEKIDSNFVDWLKLNNKNNNIQISGYVLHLISRSNPQRNYFYVKNDKILSLVQMMFSKNIRKIEHIVTSEEIDKYSYANN